MKNISDMKKTSLTLTKTPKGAKAWPASSIGKTLHSIGGLSNAGPPFGRPGV